MGKHANDARGEKVAEIDRGRYASRALLAAAARAGVAFLSHSRKFVFFPEDTESKNGHLSASQNVILAAAARTTFAAAAVEIGRFIRHF